MSAHTETWPRKKKNDREFAAMVTRTAVCNRGGAVEHPAVRGRDVVEGGGGGESGGKSSHCVVLTSCTITTFCSNVI